MMGIFLLIVGMCNLWMCGAQSTHISMMRKDGLEVPKSKYAWAVLDLVLGVYLIVSAIGYFTK